MPEAIEAVAEAAEVDKRATEVVVAEAEDDGPASAMVEAPTQVL